MKANKNVVSLITLILTVALMFSLCSLSVFAETEAEGTESAPAATEEVAESASETAAETAAATQGSSTTTGTEEEEHDIVGTIVSLCILGVIVIVVALFCIIKREKVGKFLRSLKSESKKVVWLPWNQVRKSTIVVIIVVVIVAVVIGVLDVAFASGIDALSNLF